MCDKSTKRKLGTTDVKYKIICAGKSFDIGANKQVDVVFQGRIYQAKMHSKTKGRIDGLSQLYVDAGLKEGDELKLTYDAGAGTIHIESSDMLPEGDACGFDNYKMSDLNEDLLGESLSDFTDPELSSPKFNGEYYRTGKHTIARYGDTCYFVYNKKVIICQYGNMEQHILIEGRAFPKFQRYDNVEIYVNEYGIFLYSTGQDRGIFCSMFDHQGRLTGTFEICRRGRISVDNMITDVYIVEDSFYCVSEKEFFVYRFRSGEKCQSEFILPEGKRVIGLVVGEHQVYLKVNNTSGFCDLEQWYKLVTDPTLSDTDGRVLPVFNNAESYNMPFLHPQQNIVWIETHENPEDGKPNRWTYKGYYITNGKYTGQKFQIESEFVNQTNVAYFDGNNMLLLHNYGDNMSAVDLATGKERYYGSLFKADNFLVLCNKLYILKDYLFFEHYIVSISLDSAQGEEVKLCRRLW